MSQDLNLLQEAIMLVVYSVLSLLLIISAPVAALAERGTDDHAPVQYDRSNYTEQMRISRGGQLYDDWLRTNPDAERPTGAHPLWKLQDTNKRSGYSTFRCKECHGWDYLGKDGAYGKGSHYTGFKGVFEASKRLSVSQLEDTLRGADHNFGVYLEDNDIADLALFLKKGLMDMKQLIDVNGVLLAGDETAGRDFFVRNCMIECHSGTGTAMNFGDEKNPEFIGSLANRNPWEFIHKVRMGQPGTRMPAGVMEGWNLGELGDLVVYSRTLPQDEPRAGWIDILLESLGMGKKGQRSYIPDKRRGFGPRKQPVLP